MKKSHPYVIGLVLIVAAAVVLGLAFKVSRNHNDNDSSPAVTTHSNTATVNRACQIFTLTEARALIDNAHQGQTPTLESTSDLNISSCTYIQPTGSGISVSNRNSASLLMRSPKTDKGISSNNNAFGALRPTTVENVEDYGDLAYWDSEHGQLNILKNNTWYILSYGTPSPTDRSLDQTKQLANLLLPKL